MIDDESKRPAAPPQTEDGTETRGMPGLGRGPAKPATSDSPEGPQVEASPKPAVIPEPKPE